MFYLRTSAASQVLDDHVWQLVELLFPDAQDWKSYVIRADEIKNLIDTQKARAVLSCYWFGSGATPTINPTLVALFDLMGFEIDRDFVQDQEAPQKVYA